MKHILKTSLSSSWSSSVSSQKPEQRDEAKLQAGSAAENSQKTGCLQTAQSLPPVRFLFAGRGIAGRAESENGGVTPNFIASEGLTLNNNVRVLSSQMEDAQEVLENRRKYVECVELTLDTDDQLSMISGDSTA